jgi:hypothetical protein
MTGSENESYQYSPSHSTTAASHPHALIRSAVERAVSLAFPFASISRPFLVVVVRHQ